MHDLYLDILIKRPEIIHDLHARLLHAVHQIQTDTHDLAVAFPDWSNTPGEFGLLFRLFGTNEQILDAFRNYVSSLVEHNLIRLFPVLPVPHSEKKVCFARDQSGNKFGLSAAKRRVRRGTTQETTLATPMRPTHWLNALSSSGQSFRIVIKKMSSPQQGGHRYGLGLLVPEF